MPVAITRNSLIAAASANGLGASTTTANVTGSTTANALLILAVAFGDTGGAPAAPTVTGGSLTWVQIDNQTSGNVGFAFFRALGASFTGSGLTITWAAGTDSGAWALCEFVGADASGTNGSGAIVQSVKTAAGSQTAMTMTFGGTPATTSAIYAGVGHNDTAGTMTAGAASFTLRDNVTIGTPSLHMATEDNMNGSATTTVNINSTVAGNFGFLGIEIKAQAGPTDAGNIASAEAFGSPTLSGEVDPTSIASAEAFGSPIVAAAGGVWPDFTVEVAFPNNALDLDANVTWTDLTAYVRAVRISRSRSRELARFDAGSCQVDLDNRDMRFSPENSGSAYFPYIRPNKRVRVRASHGALTRTLINAYANSWSERFFKPKDAICTLDATDAFKLFARYELPDAWAQVATAALPYSWYRLEERVGETRAYDSVAARSAITYAGTYSGSTVTLGVDSIVPGANTTVSKAATFSGATAEMSVASAQSPIPATTTVSSIVFKSSSKAYNLSDPVSLSVTKPSGVVANDTLVAFVDVKGQRTLSTPSGWTAVRAAEASGSANGDAKLYSFWKTAGASEAASYTFTQDNGGDIAAVIFAFSGCDTTTPVDVSGGSNAASGSTISAPSVTTTGANRMLVCGFAFNPGQTNTTTYSISPPSGMTEPTNGDCASKGNGSQVNNATVEAAYVAVAGAGATGAKVASLDTGSGQHAGVAVALKPTTAGAGAVPTPFTVAFWFKQTADQGNDDAYMQQGAQNGANSFDLFQSILSNGGDKKLVFRLGTNVLKSTQVIPANTACLAIARYDGALSMKLDVAGASFSSATTSTIGAAVGIAAATYEAGKADVTMDEVMAWQTALSDAQVATLKTIALGVDTSANVVDDALDLQGWPTDLRQPQSTGALTVSNLTTGTTAGTKLLDFIQSVADTERGALYMTEDGKVAFETLAFLQSDSTRITANVTFGSGVGEIGYSDLTPDYSDQIIVNDVQITNTNSNNGALANFSETYQQQDADSMNEFSRYTLTLTTNYDGALATRQTNAAARMAFELTRYAQPQRRIQSITIEGTATATDWDTLLTLTMLQRVRVNHIGPDGATTVSKDYTIRGFDWEYTASPRAVKLTLGLDEGAVASAV